MLNVFVSFLSIKGRINFLQLERFGKYAELPMAVNLRKEEFNFFEFNKRLVDQILENIIIGFDPPYLSKSGNKTHGIGTYWSGVAGKVK